MNYYTINNLIGDIGEVVEGSKCKIQFTFPEEHYLHYHLDNIKKIEPSCGCTSANKNKEGVVVYFDVGYIPFHLKNETKQKFTKRVKLILENDDSNKESLFILEFHGTTIKK